MADNHENLLIGDILDETDDEYFGNLDFERVRQGMNRNGTKSAPPAFVDVLDSHVSAVAGRGLQMCFFIVFEEDSGLESFFAPS